MEDARVERTVLFADISGSTRLLEERGDEAGRAILLACLELMEQAVTSVGGRVVERVGDEILVTFAKPEKAALAASTLHQRVKMAHTKGQLACPMRLRIGFEHGPITETEKAIYGATVHTAARLAALAKAGQTLTSKATLSRLPPILQRFSRFFDRVVLKGLPGEQEIHEILWSTDATTPSVSDPVRKTRVLSVELKYGESTVRVDASHPRVEIGRDPACDLPVEGSTVSSLHARVIWDRGRVRVEDVSTNGSVLLPDGLDPVRLHHEEATLSGAGVLCLGDARKEGGAARVAYCCTTGAE